MFDTDILIDLARRLPACVEFFDKLPDDVVAYVSVISKMELLTGCRNKEEQRKVEDFLDDFVLLPIEPEESLTACDLYARYHLSHGVGIIDSFIAATAILRRLTLYTRNRRHFGVFPDIKVAEPY